MAKIAKINKIFSFHYNGQDIYCLHRTGQRKDKEYKYTMVSSSKFPSSYIHMEDHLEEEDIVPSLPAIFIGENNDF